MNSAANHRTCGGGESLLAQPKRRSASSGVAALATVGVAPFAVGASTSVAAAARRVSLRAQANPTVDPCCEV